MHILADVGKLSIALTILIFLVQQMYSIWTHSRDQKQLRIMLDETKEITARLSTRFKGDFPLYLSAIADLLRDARTTVKIMAMIPSHGSFTKEDAWFDIEDVIKRVLDKRVLSGDLRAELIVGSGAALERDSGYLAGLDESGWENWRAKQIQLITRFFSREYRLTELQSRNLSKDRYKKGRRMESVKVCREVYRNFDRYLCSERLPMYCWIVDDKEAIFSISTENNHGRYQGSGIYTADPALIKSLGLMFDRFKKASKPWNDDKAKAMLDQFEMGELKAHRMEFQG